MAADTRSQLVPRPSDNYDVETGSAGILQSRGHLALGAAGEARHGVQGEAV